MRREHPPLPETIEAQLSPLQTQIAQRGARLFRSLALNERERVSQNQFSNAIRSEARAIFDMLPELLHSSHELSIDETLLTQYLDARFKDEEKTYIEPCLQTIKQLNQSIRDRLHYEARRQYSQMYGEREENEETPTDKNGRLLRGAALQSYYAKKARDKKHRELRENREKTIQAFRNLPLNEDALSRLSEARTIEDPVTRERQREEILAESIGASLGRELNLPDESLTYLQELSLDLSKTVEKQRAANEDQLDGMRIPPEDQTKARNTLLDSIRRHPKLAATAVVVTLAGAFGVKAGVPQTVYGLARLAQTHEHVGDPMNLSGLSYKELVTMGIIDEDPEVPQSEDIPPSSDNEETKDSSQVVEDTITSSQGEHPTPAADPVANNAETEEASDQTQPPVEANVDGKDTRPVPRPLANGRQLHQTGDELDEFEVAEQQGLLSNLYQLVEQNRADRADADEFFLERIDPELNKGRVNIFLLGLDERRTDQGGNYRADAIIVLSLDSTTGTIDMLNIPRDLHAPEVAEIAGMPGTYFRINACSSLGGLSDCSRIIENATGLSGDIVTYANFEAFIELISKVGSVTIDIDESFINKYGDIFRDMFGINLSPGPFALKGDALLYYSRVRKNDSDTHRNARQQQVIEAVSRQFLSMAQDMDHQEFLNLITGLADISGKGRFGFGEGISFPELLDVLKDSLRTGIGDMNFKIQRHGAGWLNWLTGQIPAENQKWQTVPEGSSPFIGQTEAGGQKPSEYWSSMRNAVQKLLTNN